MYDTLRRMKKNVDKKRKKILIKQVKDRQTHGQTDKQTDRHRPTDRQKHLHRESHPHGSFASNYITNYT